MTTTTPRGAWWERSAWGLLAFISGVLVLFGSMMMLPQTTAEPISGSGCCNGQSFADVQATHPWVVDYLTEMARYMGSFTIGMGILALAVTLGPFRRRQRWAWGVLWLLPALFVFHGAVLGSFPFDLAPMAVSLLGLMLPLRLFFGQAHQHAAGRRAATTAPEAIQQTS